MKRFAVLIILIVTSLAVQQSDSNLLWPLPINYTYETEGQNLTVSPCEINFNIEAADKIYVQEIITLYLLNVFKCSSSAKGNYTLTVQVANAGQLVATDKKHEKYTLEINNSSLWTLKADYYVGFLRGI